MLPGAFASIGSYCWLDGGGGGVIRPVPLHSTRRQVARLPLRSLMARCRLKGGVPGGLGVQYPAAPLRDGRWPPEPELRRPSHIPKHEPPSVSVTMTPVWITHI